MTKAAKQTQNHINRIVGQVNGIKKMMHQKEECDKVLLQIMAARASLERLAKDLATNDAKSCIKGKNATKVYNSLNTLIKNL